MGGTASTAGCPACSDSSLAEFAGESSHKGTGETPSSPEAAKPEGGTSTDETMAGIGEEDTGGLSADWTSGNDAVELAMALLDKIRASDGAATGSVSTAPHGGVAGGVDGETPTFMAGGMPRVPVPSPKTMGAGVLEGRGPVSTAWMLIGMADQQ